MGITKNSASERGRVGWLVFLFLNTCNYAQDLIVWGEESFLPRVICML